MSSSVYLIKHQCSDTANSLSQNVQVFCHSQCELAEAPTWHDTSESLLWVDILKNRLFQKPWSSKIHWFWELPETVSSIALDVKDDGNVWLVSEHAIIIFNLHSGLFRPVINLDLGRGFRANDGAVGPDGRYWFGSMLRNPLPEQGTVYSVGSAGDIRSEIVGVAIPNTFCWQSTNLLISDSLLQICRKYRFNNGRILPNSEAEIFLDHSRMTGTPDGGAVDSDGNVWLALWGAGRLVACNPTGTAIAEIELPVPQPSSCCFGGPDNKWLFVSTAKEGLNHHELMKYSDSGNIFAVNLERKGAIVPKFKMEL